MTTLDPHLRWLLAAALAAGACAERVRDAPRASPGDDGSDPGAAEGASGSEREQAGSTPDPSARGASVSTESVDLGPITVVSPATVPTGEPSLVGESTCGEIGVGVRPVGAVDGVAVLFKVQLPSGVRGVLERKSAGSPCASASDSAACELALEHPPEEDLRVQQRGRNRWSWILGWTAGDRVGWVSNAAELRAFLGPIDSPADARLILWQEGYDVDCEIDEDEGGYALRARKVVNHCPETIRHYELRVGRDGAVSKVSERLGEPGVCMLY